MNQDECSASLALSHFVNNDSIMAEIINSTEHARHEEKLFLTHGLLLLYEFHSKSSGMTYVSLLVIG